MIFFTICIVIIMFEVTFACILSKEFQKEKWMKDLYLFVSSIYATLLLACQFYIIFMKHQFFKACFILCLAYSFLQLFIAVKIIFNISIVHYKDYIKENISIIRLKLFFMILIVCFGIFEFIDVRKEQVSQEKVLLSKLNEGYYAKVVKLNTGIEKVTGKQFILNYNDENSSNDINLVANSIYLDTNVTFYFDSSEKYIIISEICTKKENIFGISDDKYTKKFDIHVPRDLIYNIESYKKINY